MTEELFKCEFCDRVFQKKAGLRSHKSNVHMREKVMEKLKK